MELEGVAIIIIYSLWFLLPLILPAIYLYIHTADNFYTRPISHRSSYYSVLASFPGLSFSREVHTVRVCMHQEIWSLGYFHSILHHA